MSSSEQKRRKRRFLFQIYSKQLEHLNADYKGQYACPVCHRLFPIEATEKDAPEDARLTIDHIPPNACGGQDEVLLCSVCNREAGHGPDAELDRDLSRAASRDKGQRFIDPGWKETLGYDRAWLGGRDNGLVVRVRTRPGGIEVFPEPGTTDGQHYRDYLKERIQREGPVELQLSFPMGKPSRDMRPPDKMQLRASLFRSAYLLAFLHLGYAYILLPHVIPLREWILSPEDHQEDISATIVNMPSSAEVPWGSASTLCFVELENCYRCFGVALNLESEGYRRHHVILLPPPVIKPHRSFPNGEMLSLRAAKSHTKLRLVGLKREHLQECFKDEEQPMALLAGLWASLLNECS